MIQGDKFSRSCRVFLILWKYCVRIANPAISQCSYTPLFPLETPSENCFQLAVREQAKNIEPGQNHFFLFRL